ncbi:MAG TPA: cytochrome c biogenesis protein CcdA [bacterium]
MTPPPVGLAQAVAAGATSVLSSCFLPVLPVLVGGAGGRGARRPAALALGLALAFLLMGVLSSLRGDLLVGRTRLLEVAGTGVIALVGLLGLAAAPAASGAARRGWATALGTGAAGGAAMGLSLGLTWVPCIGPALSEILGAVGSPGTTARGVLLLGAYSLGLAVPLLAVAFAAHLPLRRLARGVAGERFVRVGSAAVLLTYGACQAVHGNLAY